MGGSLLTPLVTSLRILPTVKTLSGKGCRYHLLSEGSYSQYQKNPLENQDLWPARAASPNKSPSSKASRSPLSLHKWLVAYRCSNRKLPHATFTLKTRRRQIPCRLISSCPHGNHFSSQKFCISTTVYPRVIIVSLWLLIFEETQETRAGSLLVLSTPRSCRQVVPQRDCRPDLHMQ